MSQYLTHSLKHFYSHANYSENFFRKKKLEEKTNTVPDYRVFRTNDICGLMIYAPL